MAAPKQYRIIARPRCASAAGDALLSAAISCEHEQH
jgi:hypothetical protein